MLNTDYYILDNSDIEEKKLEAAKGLYRVGNYSGALKLYLDMVNTSFSYKLYYEIGRCYYKLGDIGNAENHFKRSIELESYKNPSYIFLGNIYFRKEEAQKAIEYWTTSFSYKPDDESVCLNLATSYFSKDMRFQSLFFYEKYLKYAKDKTSSYYLEIKNSIENFIKISREFYQKAQMAISAKDNKTAIQVLSYAVKNYPLNFDTNLLLGKLYFEEQDYMHALIYFKQAFSLDNKSLDVLQRLSTTMIKLGDFTGAYCCLKRMLPLVMGNQKEYLEILKTIKPLEESFDKLSHQGHLEWADNYFNENNYHFALFEYENCLIVNGNLAKDLSDKIHGLKSFINPEERIIKSCFEIGGAHYSNKNYREANKYFTKIMNLSTNDSSDYKFAKSRIVNV
jgi:tetratricopeptide (TPR) repeat protein